MKTLRQATAFVHNLGADRLKFLAVVTGGHFAIHWFQQLFPVVLPSVKAGLGLSDVEAGALASARQLVQGTLDLPSGILADSLARRRALILASALVSMGAGYLFFGWMTVFAGALVGAGLIGLGTALWHPAAAAALSHRFPELRATALSIHGMGATVSDTLTPLVAGALLVGFSWNGFLGFQLLPAILVALVVWRGLLRVLPAAGASSGQPAQLRDLADLARNRVFLGLTAAKALMQMGRLVVLTFLPIYLQEHLNYSPFELGIYITLLHAMGTVSQPILGYLSDHFGRKAVMVPSFAALAILFFLLALVEPGLPLGLVVTAIGLFFYTLMNITFAAVMDVAGAKIQASSYGLTSLLTEVVVMPTPMIAGLLIGIYGIRVSFMLAGVFLGLAALVTAPLDLYKGSRTRPRE
ncbi:MAG TPA: MFS transporter [Candidatus Acidoferrales bacterium]|nr:MFS transporter [Candidatus Acidoferrales bacterium]